MQQEVKRYTTDLELEITQRKKAEESAMFQVQLLNLVGESVIVTNYDGTVIYWNQAAENMYGWTRSEALGRNVVDVTVSNMSQKDANEIFQRLATGQHWEGEYKVSRKDGTEFLIWAHDTPVLDKNGKISVIIGVSIDITERKKAEEALKESESKFKTLAENAPDAIMRFDKNLRILYLNPQDLAETGKPLEELVGKTNEEIGMPTELCKLWNDTFYRAKTSRKAQEVEFDFKTPKGLKTFNLRIVPEFSETGSLRSYIGISRDITERKKAEEALRQSEDKLDEYNKNLKKLVEERTKQLKDSERLAAIGATAGMVGHDIRNPLQAITGDLFLAKSELSELPENENKTNALESLNEIQNNIDYINKIVADLQDYARPLNPRAQETDIESVFNEIFVSNSVPKNVKVSVDIETKAKRIMVDPDYLKRISANLTLNAVQAMPDGGKLNIHAYVDRATNDVLITVKDTGVGIPEDIKPKLFTPMMTTKSKGQGFGLAVVKRMTEGLGGTVTFESTQGKGTTFILRLPPPKELNGKWTYK
jgi:two-component system sporulation sensor kinase A